MTDPTAYIEELERLLLNQPDACMLLPELDGFLTGILVSPDLVKPTQWLKLVWSGDDGDGHPEFETMEGFQHFIDLVMRHYHAILECLDRPGSFEPLLEIDQRNGDVLWEMWIEGFVRAMNLAPRGWQQVAVSEDAQCRAAVAGIKKLWAICEGRSRLGALKEREWEREAPDLIPIWVEQLHRWRQQNDPDASLPQVRQGKVGRNEPCPCGSGKKYKKCCGLN